MYKRQVNSNVHFQKEDTYDFQLENTLDMKVLMKKFKLSSKNPQSVKLDVSNTDRAFGAVSYTHLDVYKRQAFASASPAPAPVSDYEMQKLWQEPDPDRKSLCSFVLFGLRGMAAYSYHARAPLFCVFAFLN